jgi:multidrug efflux pump subunit AcrA (membrane-fusion protein)
MHRFKNIYFRLANRFGARRTNIGLVLLSTALIYIGYSLISENNAAAPEPQMTTAARTVSLYTISAAANGTAVRTADGNAFIVRSESDGRVESIAKVGDQLTSGTIVAHVENSAERAAVLQAQGAYEAAKAAAAVSDVGNSSAIRSYDEATTQALNTYRSTFATVDDVLRNTVDDVFSHPSAQLFGLRIRGGNTQALTEERLALETVFIDWKNSLTTLSPESSLLLVTTAESNTKRLSTLVGTLIFLLNDSDALGSGINSNTAELEILRSDFAKAQATLNATLQTLSATRSALIAAESQKDQSTIAASSGSVSLADAQVKQALGALESARAALAKTSVKTPVAGTVTAVSISVGDIISIGSDVVFVASDETMEMETKDTVTVPLTSVKFTPSKAFVFTVEEGRLVAHEVKTGSVTTNSITISGLGGVISIVLDVRGLKEGDAVITQ